VEILSSRRKSIFMESPGDALTGKVRQNVRIKIKKTNRIFLFFTGKLNTKKFSPHQKYQPSFLKLIF
jgi:hypothetical protein